MFIPLDRDSAFPLSRQISTYLEELIRRGHLGPGARLPATRTLARELGVNRKTVEAAYDELRARRLVTMRAGRGGIVRSALPENPELDLPFRASRGRDPFPPSAWSPPADPPEALRDLAGEGPRLRNLTPATLRRLHREALEGTGAPFGEPSPLGEPSLRRAASVHLARCGVLRGAEEIAIVRDRTTALRRLLDLFVPDGGRVLLDGPVDPELVDALRGRTRAAWLGERERWSAETRRLPRLIVVATGRGRVPGPVPDLPRRKAILDFAREHGIPLLEDVTGADRAPGPQPPPLAALDPSGRVFPLADLSDEVGGGLRAAAIAATPKAIDRLRTAAEGDAGPDRLTQRVIGLALESPGRARAVRAVRERRELLRAPVRRALQRRLPELTGYEFSADSDAVRVDLPEDCTGDALRRYAEQHGLRLRSARDCGRPSREDRFVLLDLTGHEEGELLEGVRRLGAAFDEWEEARATAD